MRKSILKSGLAWAFVLALSQCAPNIHENPPPVVIAHRGFHQHAPENTMESFSAAQKHGILSIELDIQSTRDDTLVVFHDADLERMTGHTAAVSLLTLSEIRHLRIQEKYRIPTLQEVFTQFGGAFDPIFVDVKAVPNLRRLTDMIESHGLFDKVVVTSPAIQVLDSIRSMDKRIRLAYDDQDYKLLSSFASNDVLPKSIENEFEYILLPYFKVTRMDCMIAKEKGIGIVVWTPNSMVDMIETLDFPLYGVMTDYPLMLSHILK